MTGQPQGTFTTDQVAIVLGISTAGVRKLKAAGRITPIGGTPRHPLYSAAVIATYQQQKTGPDHARNPAV
jgi:hypothetical protein